MKKNKNYLKVAYIPAGMLDEVIKSYNLLDDLHHRLVEDYNGGKAFEQYEEDRLITGKLLHLIDLLIVGSDYKYFDQEDEDKLLYDIIHGKER